MTPSEYDFIRCAVLVFSIIMDRIKEYPELEGTCKSHQVQLLPPHRTTQKSDCISEDIV